MFIRFLPSDLLLFISNILFDSITLLCFAFFFCWLLLTFIHFLFFRFCINNFRISLKILPHTPTKESTFWINMEILYEIDVLLKWNMQPSWGIIYTQCVFSSIFFFISFIVKNTREPVRKIKKKKRNTKKNHI